MSDETNINPFAGHTQADTLNNCCQVTEFLCSYTTVDTDMLCENSMMGFYLTLRGLEGAINYAKNQK